MKKIIFNLILLLLPVFGFSQNYFWINEVSGISAEEPVAMATDANGNTIVTGKYTSPTLTIGNTTLTNGNDNQTFFDVFMVKHDTDGNVLWAATAGGPNHDEPYDIELDDAGNIYVFGLHGEQAEFGNTTLNTDSQNEQELFIAKYDSNGEFQWAKVSDDILHPFRGETIEVDGAGNVYIAGAAVPQNPTASLFGFAFPEVEDKVGFLVKLDTDGNGVWIKRFDSSDPNSMGSGFSLTTSSINSDGTRICLGGSFDGVIQFGNQSATSSNYAVPNSGYKDLYVVCLDHEGTTLWLETTATSESHIFSSENEIAELGFDASNNVYVSGTLNSELIFSNSQNIEHENSGNHEELFLTKLNPEGGMLWVEKVFSQQNNEGIEPRGMAVNSAGDIFLTGYYEWNPVFGNFPLPVLTHGTFIAKYNTGGGVEWAKGDAGSVSEGLAIGIDASENVYVTGYYWSFPSFGSTTLNNAGLRGAYVLKYDAQPLSIKNQYKNLLQFEVSPNPTSDFLQIKIDDHDFQNGQIQMIDLLGKVLLEFDLEEKTPLISTSHLPNGTYFLNISGEDFYGIQKIIVQKY